MSRTLVAWLWTLFIALVCFLPAEEIPDDQVVNADKIVHLISFCILTFLWIPSLIRQYSFPLLRLHAIKVSFLFSIFFGGAIELIQHWGVKYRNGEWADWIFDIIGSLLGIALFLMIYGKKQIKNKKYESITKKQRR